MPLPNTPSGPSRTKKQELSPRRGYHAYTHGHTTARVPRRGVTQRMYTLHHSPPSVFYDLPVFFLKPRLPLPLSSSPSLPSLPHVSPLSLASRRPDNTPLTHQGHQHRYTTIRPTEAAHRGVIGHIGLLDHPAIKMGVKYFLGWPPYGAVQMEVVDAHDGRQRRIGGV